ncbi:MAG: ABC-2 type transport system permease protein, partial [Gammaproteobacteria bacterium]
GGQYWGSNLADSDLKNRIQRSINRTLQRSELEARGLDVDAVAEVNDTTLKLAALDPKKEAGKEEVSTADQIRQWAPVGFVYLLWIGIFTISQMLLNNTVEEKSNRIIEVLLSSVTAGELMMGKLAGIAGIGLTMIGVWMGSLVTILSLSAGPEAEFPTMLLDVLLGSGLIYWFVLYFCLGYLLYAGIFLAIGSLCNTIKDAQNLMGPVMLVMMVPIITMMFIPKDPNGTLATILSWIPLYTPFTMMNRAAADPPMFDKIGTLILLVVFTLFTLVMVGRIFRAGILRTGQPPKIRELLSWMKS